MLNDLSAEQYNVLGIFAAISNEFSEALHCFDKALSLECALANAADH